MNTDAKRIELISYVDGIAAALEDQDADDLEVWYRILLPVAVDAGALWVQSHGQGAIGEFYVVDVPNQELIAMPYADGGLEQTFWLPEIRHQVENASRQQIDRYHAWATALIHR